MVWSALRLQVALACFNSSSLGITWYWVVMRSPKLARKFSCAGADALQQHLIDLLLSGSSLQVVWTISSINAM